MMTKHSLLVLVVGFVVLGLAEGSNSTNGTEIPCPPPCVCHTVQSGRLAVTCNLSDNTVDGSLVLPRQTYSLDLSHSRLTRIPTKLLSNLTSLFSLSLAWNNITTIEEHSLKGLEKLEVLNLRYIGLREWKGIAYFNHSSLRILDITGNNRFSFDKKLLQLSSLMEIRGASWSEYCMDCTLKRAKEQNESIIVIIKGGPPVAGKFPEFPPNNGTGITFKPVGGKARKNCKTNLAMEYFELGFDINCTGNMKKQKCIPSSFCDDSKEHMRNHGKLLQKFFYSCYALGGMAIPVNIVVFFNIILSKKLRRNVSMVLIANMAACDVIIGIYTMLVPELNIFNIIATSNMKSGSRCSVSSVLFTVGESVSVATSVLLTIEKYLSIVHVMNPDLRLKKKQSAVCLLVVFLASLLYSLSPFYAGSSDLAYSPGLLCTMPTTQETSLFLIFIAILVLYYLSMIPMYIRIFLFVHRSGSRMGVRRDATLAKNVAVLIGSNFLFFVAPMVGLLINVLLIEGHRRLDIPPTPPTFSTQAQYILLYWLPVACLGFNSLLNPFLYAFKRRQFQREFVARACVGEHLSARIQRVLSFLASRRSSSQSSQTRMEVYNMEQQPGTQQKRSSSEIIPRDDTSAAVLCNARKISDQSL